MAELHITVHNRSLVKASDSTKEPYNLQPSNFDMFPGPFPIVATYIYPKPVTGCFSSVLATVRRTLPEILNYYFPFAGRMAGDPSTGSLFIACNNEGAELVEAEADIPLSSVNFTEVKKSLDKIILPFSPELCLSVQLISYPCGGFSIVWGSNHLLVDGYSIVKFSNLWAELVRTNKISWTPCHDRGMLKPRAPPTYGPEIERRFKTITLNDMVNVLAADVFVRRLYRIEAADLDRLRAATVGSSGGPATKTEAFSAYLWKLLARAVGEADTHCRMGWLVDGRQWMGREKKMSNYVGNVITLAEAEAPVQEVAKSSMSDLARTVSSAIGEVANETHFQDMNDWFETTKSSIRIAKVQLGLGSPSLVVSSCVNMSSNMDFGYGRPALAMPQISWGRLASAFMIVAKNPKNDGSWVLLAFVWPGLAAAIEADPMGLFRPLTADYLGFGEGTVTTATSQHEILSRL